MPRTGSEETMVHNHTDYMSDEGSNRATINGDSILAGR